MSTSTSSDERQGRLARGLATVRLLGGGDPRACDIHAVTEQEALTRILERCAGEGRGTATVVTVNAAILMMLRKDAALRHAVEAADLVVADGTPLVWASRWLGRPLPGRVTGVDLMSGLLDAGSSTGLRVFLLGTTQERLDRLGEVVRTRYPGVVVAGARNGYFGPAQHAEVAEQIAAARADLLLVGMPAPMKEIWCERHRAALETPVVLGVGGAFDVLAGHVRRAPRWVQNAGLEWLWRLALEPRKLWKRYLVTNAQFVGLLVSALAARWTRLSRSAHLPVSGVEALDGGWDGLAMLQAGALRGSPVQRMAWARAAHDSGTPILPVVVGDPSAPAAIAALQRVRGRELELSAHGEPIDVLHRDPESLARLCAALAGTGVPIKLWRLPADSPTRAAIERAYRRRGLVLTKSQPACPVMRLDESWQEPERRFNAGRRSDIRRYRRRAEAIGGVATELLTPRPDEVPALLDEVVEVEGAGWKRRAGTALAVDHERRHFFRRWATYAAADGTLRVAFLRIGGRAAAMQLAAEDAGRLWLIKVGYDEAFARCSPGFLLMLDVVADAARRGLESVEFLGEAEAWTSLWCAESRPTVSVATYPYGMAGGLALARDAITVARNRVRDARAAAQDGQCPPPKVRHISRRPSFPLAAPASRPSMSNTRDDSPAHPAETWIRRYTQRTSGGGH